MSQQVQELIDKIKSDGVAAAQEKANSITEEANTKATHIISDAEQQAEKMISDAHQEIKKLKESTEMSLKQSSRDMVLSLRKNIETILKRIVKENVTDALKPQTLAKILEAVISKAAAQKMDVASIEVALSAKDLQALKKGFVSKLQKKIKEPISFKSSDEISGGFTISFDKGKSNFDFTDEALAQYLGNFVNIQVAQLVKESVK